MTETETKYYNDGRYEVEESFNEKGLWKGYTVRVAEAKGQKGTLYPTGKDGKGIEIKEDANKSVTPDSFQKA